MINATLMKTVALAALLSMASACQAADLTVVTNNRSIEQITDAIMTWVSDQ